MLNRSPIAPPSTSVVRLNRIVLQVEAAQVQLRWAVEVLDAKGRDSSAVRRRLRKAGPILSELRLRRLRLIAARWRTPPPTPA